MNFVAYAVPFFLFLIIVEMAWGYWRGDNTYRVNDSLNSLSLGLLSTLTKLLVLNIGMLVFVQVEQNYSLIKLNQSNTWHWLLALLLYDFIYYWYHRISHERQIFWASHVVHHQSEDYNLTTALRQTSTGFLITWVFFIPCFLLGMSVQMYATIASLHLLYQFWIHTQHIPKLGFLEWIFITPSNHRVHHGQNPEYIDKNHGGLLIIWDRLFGTYEPEQQPAIYGLTTPLASWNPLWANLHVFYGMGLDIVRARSWRDKARVLWARTGWQPEDVQENYPQTKTDLSHFKKFGLNFSRSANAALIGQYLLLTVFHVWAMSQVLQQAYVVLLSCCLVQFYMTMVLAAALQAKPYVVLLEWSRILVLLVLLLGGYNMDLLSFFWLLAGLSYLLVSALLMAVAISSIAADEAYVVPES